MSPSLRPAFALALALAACGGGGSSYFVPPRPDAAFPGGDGGGEGPDLATGPSPNDLAVQPSEDLAVPPAPDLAWPQPMLDLARPQPVFDLARPPVADLAMPRPDLATPRPDLAMPKVDLAMNTKTGCNGFLDCYSKCASNACIDKCFMSTSPQGQTLVGNLFDCLDLACPGNKMGDPCFDPQSQECDDCGSLALGQGGKCFNALSACRNHKP